MSPCVCCMEGNPWGYPYTSSPYANTGLHPPSTVCPTWEVSEHSYTRSCFTETLRTQRLTPAVPCSIPVPRSADGDPNLSRSFFLPTGGPPNPAAYYSPDLHGTLPMTTYEAWDCEYCRATATRLWYLCNSDGQTMNSQNEPQRRPIVRKRAGARCANCQTTTTVVWRMDANGVPVCNACGLYYKRHQVNRPVPMQRYAMKTRKRRASQKKKKAASSLGGPAPADAPASGLMAGGSDGPMPPTSSSTEEASVSQ